MIVYVVCFLDGVGERLGQVHEILFPDLFGAFKVKVADKTVVGLVVMELAERVGRVLTLYDVVGVVSGGGKHWLRFGARQDYARKKRVNTWRFQLALFADLVGQVDAVWQLIALVPCRPAPVVALELTRAAFHFLAAHLLVTLVCAVHFAITATKD